MKNKNTFKKPLKSLQHDSGIDSNFSTSTAYSSKYSQHLLSYYKQKSIKLEKEFNELVKVIEKIKETCDRSNELQKQLNSRNAEISELQKVISDLQIHLFKEKEQNLKLSGENDELRVEDYTNKRKINLLLVSCGANEKTFLKFTPASQQTFVPPKLPPKLQKLKEMKQKELFDGKPNTCTSNTDLDPQILSLNNQLLASQLEHHTKISREQIKVLLKEKELSEEERKVERQRLEKELESVTNKLKESQELLCEATERLIRCQQLYEKEKTMWMEEKNKYEETIDVLRDKVGKDVPDVVAYCLAKEKLRVSDDKVSEKSELAAAYQEKVLALESEVYRLRERAQMCRNAFREKTEKMTSQVIYLKGKYEDLDRRRLLEAEGFRTDIKMLRERVVELEKKLAKASGGVAPSEQQQLLISAKNTLNRAKLLEKELALMKSKILSLELNEESGS